MEEDSDKVPSKLKICYEEVNFWIFQGADEVKCHFCKNSWHIVKFCPELDVFQDLEADSSNSQENSDQENSAASTMNDVTLAGYNSMDFTTEKIDSASAQKRHASSSVSGSIISEISEPGGKTENENFKKAYVSNSKYK